MTKQPETLSFECEYGDENKKVKVDFWRPGTNIPDEKKTFIPHWIFNGDNKIKNLKFICKDCGCDVDEILSSLDNDYCGPCFNKKNNEERVWKKEEFKVDKLGWYETRDKEDRIEIVYIFRKHNNHVLGIKNGLSVIEFQSNGQLLENETSVMDLIKYLGPELPKEPRKFEFEAYMGEMPLQSDYLRTAFEDNLKMSCSAIVSSKNSLGSYWEKISKWKVTMVEVLE